LDLIFKIQPSTDHDAKLCADWPVELGDTVAKQKFFLKTSAVKHKSARKAIASGRTKNDMGHNG